MPGLEKSAFYCCPPRKQNFIRPPDVATSGRMAPTFIPQGNREQRPKRTSAKSPGREPLVAKNILSCPSLQGSNATTQHSHVRGRPRCRGLRPVLVGAPSPPRGHNAGRMAVAFWNHHQNEPSGSCAKGCLNVDKQNCSAAAQLKAQVYRGPKSSHSKGDWDSASAAFCSGSNLPNMDCPTVFLKCPCHDLAMPLRVAIDLQFWVVRQGCRVHIRASLKGSGSRPCNSSA